MSWQAWRFEMAFLWWQLQTCDVDCATWMVSIWYHACLDDSLWQIPSMETTSGCRTHTGNSIGERSGSPSWVLMATAFLAWCVMFVWVRSGKWLRWHCGGCFTFLFGGWFLIVTVVTPWVFSWMHTLSYWFVILSGLATLHLWYFLEWWQAAAYADFWLQYFSLRLGFFSHSLFWIHSFLIWRCCGWYFGLPTSLCDALDRLRGATCPAKLERLKRMATLLVETPLMSLIQTLDDGREARSPWRDHTKTVWRGSAPFTVSKKGREKKRDFTKKAFLTLSWPNLGLHLEISRLEISPRKLSWPYLDPILGFILKALG